MPPAMNVRVMSAQQRDWRSRGQMSTITTSPSPIGPWPDSWPTADCGPWATITSSGRSQPCSSQTACIASRTSSLVVPPSRIIRAPTAIACVGRPLGAADALDLGLATSRAAW